MRWLGPLIAMLVVAAAGALAIQTYMPYGLDTAFGVALGGASLAAMSLALMLAARPTGLEPLFGGLGRMYDLHKWLGIAALALMIGHNVIEPDLEHWVRETGWGEAAEEVGEFAFNGFLGLILISWIKRLPFTRMELPWPLWRFTHRFTGLLFAVAAFHQLAIDQPVPMDDPFRLYVNALCVAGIGAWLFTQLIAPLIRRRSFVLEQVTRHGPVTELTLRPEGRPMRWKPGQFALLSATGVGMGEPHPFTLASAPNADGRVRFAIKALGDWTKRLPARLAAGQRMRIEGPYGRFLFRRRARHQVWLAGGIGITPFLAWAEALRPEHGAEIVLVWAVSTRQEAYAAQRLEAIAARRPRFTVHIVISAEQGRLTAQALVAMVPFPIRLAELFYCGPTGLRRAILAGLKALGQSPRRVHTEAFEWR